MLLRHRGTIINNLVLRCLSKTVISTNTDESFKHTKKEHEASQKGSAQILQNLLGLRPMVARDIVSKYKNFHKIPKRVIEENYKYSLENGILQETLQKLPQVLAESEIPLKTSHLKGISYDINITTPLLSLTYKCLRTYFNKETKTDRIALISELLEVLYW